LLSLATRERLPELMDQPGLRVATHRDALVGLRRVNVASQTVAVLWKALCRARFMQPGSPPVRLLDIGSGGGDVLIGLARMAQRHGVMLESHGCDTSATAVAHARLAANRAAVANVRFSRCDALCDSLPGECDVALSTLFLHHLGELDAVELLRRMAAAARRAVLVDDLLRSRSGYAMAWAGCRLLTRSRVVHVDGPRSVRSAFSLSEVRGLAEQAGLEGATLRRHWPERFLLSWRKP
jgi:SAM-dependent methyltransferase